MIVFLCILKGETSVRPVTAPMLKLRYMVTVYNTLS